MLEWASTQYFYSRARSRVESIWRLDIFRIDFELCFIVGIDKFQFFENFRDPGLPEIFSLWINFISIARNFLTRYGNSLGFQSLRSKILIICNRLLRDDMKIPYQFIKYSQIRSINLWYLVSLLGFLSWDFRDIFKFLRLAF